MPEYIIIEGYLKTLKQVQCIKSDAMAFGSLKGIDLYFPSKAWRECKELFKYRRMVYLKGNYNNSNSKKPCFTVCGLMDPKKEECFLCGKVNDYRMHILKDGRYLCNTCKKNKSVKQCEISVTICREGTPLFDDDEIDDLLILLVDE